jgi:hypothetical protein
MNRAELFNEVKTWLDGEKLSFFGNEEEANCQIRMNLDNGLVQVRLVCEESPTSLQVICALPVKVPQGKTTSAAVMLHNINKRLRIGSFQLLTDERIITFRVTVPIHPEADLPRQISSAFGMVLSTMDEYLLPLGLHLCSTDETQATLSKLLPDEPAAGIVPCLPRSRLELN